MTDQPRTAAGRRLLEIDNPYLGDDLRGSIRAIEDEAQLGHAECEANMDALINRQAAAITAAIADLRGRHVVLEPPNLWRCKWCGQPWARDGGCPDALLADRLEEALRG